MKEVDGSSLEHTSWRCQYHVVLPIVFSITLAPTITPKVRF